MPSFNLFSDNRLSPGKTLGVVAAYAAVVFIGALHHELWLDEAHHFLLGLWSNSLHQLLFNARYEGHPILWNALIMTVTRFTFNPVSMQVLNVILSCIAVWVFLRYAPFSIPFKLLFISGYFMIYEYSVISRNYSISCMWLFVVLCLYPYRADKRKLFALAVVVLANTHLFSAAINTALLIQMVLEYFYSGKKENSRQVLYASCIIFFGIALAVYQIAPPVNELFYLHGSGPSHFVAQARKVYATFFRGVFNFPDISTYYSWNTNMLTDRWWYVTRLFLPLPAILAFILLIKKPFALVFLILSVAGIMFAEFVARSTDSRHSGFIYLAFISALWMSRYEANNIWLTKPVWLNTFAEATLKPAEIMVWLVLVLQVISGGILYSKDIYQPFSESKETCNYLTEHSLQNKFIMVNNQNLGPTVSSYLHRSVYYAADEREGTFCYWNTQHWVIDDTTLLARVNAQLVQHDSIVLLLDSALTQSVIQNGKITLLQVFNHAFIKNENFWIYLAVRTKQSEGYSPIK